MNQKRWFIGTLLPPNISEAITTVQHKLIDESTMQPPLMPHITLMHPNPLMELSPLYFAPIAKIAAQKVLPCTIQLQHIAVFHNNVLYIAVKSPELIQIHNQLVSLLPKKIQAQFFVGRDFVPHVTLAQTKNLHTIKLEHAKQFKQAIEPLLPTSFTLHKLTRCEWQSPRSYTAKDL